MRFTFFHEKLLIYLFTYLQRVRVNNNFSSFINDDNTLYASGFKLEELKNCLSTDF